MVLLCPAFVTSEFGTCVIWVAAYLAAIAPKENEIPDMKHSDTIFKRKVALLIVSVCFDNSAPSYFYAFRDCGCLLYTSPSPRDY